MFLNLLFLVLILLALSFSPEGEVNPLMGSSWVAFGASMLLYAAVLGVIFLQSRYLFKRRSNRTTLLSILANLELLVFFIIYNFFFAGQRIWESFPWIGEFQIFPILFALILYFLGLTVLYWSEFKHGRLSQPVSRNLRFLIPFTIPYLIITLLGDIAWNIPNENLHHLLTKPDPTWAENVIYLGFTFLLIVILMIFLPYFIQRIWQCKPITNQALISQLQGLCHRTHFKHSGMLEWTIFSHMPTAAIIGIIPRFRYVVFTPSLMDQLSPTETEAVLAHEIGHSKHKHLFIYPFIILGLVVLTGIILNLTAEPLINLFNSYNEREPSSLWLSFYLLVNFVIFACIIMVYIRLAFGYFSRLFERQADLYVFKVGIPPEAMINALDRIGTITGNSHRTPSWHHYSIQQRMDFLRQASADPSLIAKHNRWVYWSLIIYFIILGILLFLLIYT